MSLPSYIEGGWKEKKRGFIRKLPKRVSRKIDLCVLYYPSKNVENMEME